MRKLMNYSLIVVFMVTGICGCLDPSRSQTMNWDNVVVYINAVPAQDGTNGTVSATGAAGATYGDILSMAQMLEHSGGSESDTRSYGNPTIPTGTDAITALVGAGAEGITKGLTDGENEKDAAEGAGDCVDGNCSDSEDCPDGSCSDR